MTDTFEAVAVVTLALLPGALYTWAFEHIVGPWGVGFADRLLRFTGYSAILHVLLLPITYSWYRLYVHSGDLAAGRSLPPILWFAAICYVLGPILLGSLIGQATKRNAVWVTFIVGKQPAPRAWDELFLQGGTGYIQLKLKSTGDGDGQWLAGWFGTAFISGRSRRSRVARYPEAQDLYLVQTFECDPVSGDLLVRNGEVITRNQSLLVRWEQVEYLLFEVARRRSPE